EQLTFGAKSFILGGSGVGGNGVIINSGTVHQQNGISQITMTGDTTFGGPGDYTATGNPGRWDMRQAASSPTPSLSTTGHAYKLTKVGQNQIILLAVAFDSALGNIDIQGGLLGFETTTTFGDPNFTLSVEPPGTLE